MTLAIFRGCTRYIVRASHKGKPARLWAVLGPAYTRATAQALADALTAEAAECKQARKRRNR